MSGYCHGCGVELPPKTWKGRDQKWCSGRCRKRSYGDPCVDCGKQTRYGAEMARVPDPRCAECAPKHYKIWTREALICAIEDWAATYGEPPAMPDWNPWMARNTLHDEERARRYEAGRDRWPGFSSVVRAFGSWNAALVAAGFEPRAAHGGGGNVSRRRSQRQKVAA